MNQSVQRSAKTGPGFMFGHFPLRAAKNKLGQVIGHEKGIFSFHLGLESLKIYIGTIILQQSPKLSFILLAITAAVFMGTIGVLARFAALPAEHITFYRLFLGALFLIIYMLVSAKGSPIIHKPAKRTIINGMMLAGFMAFYIQAMNHTSMANAVMLVYLAPLLTAVIAHFIFAEKLAPVNIFAIALALLGFAMMMEFSLSLSGSEHETSGLIYGVLSLLTYSGFMLINRKPGDSTPYQSTLVQLLVGALCMLPLVLSSPVRPSVSKGCGY